MHRRATDLDSALGEMRVADAAEQRRVRRREAELAATETNWSGILTACERVGAPVAITVDGRRRVVTVDRVGEQWVLAHDEHEVGAVRLASIEIVEPQQPTPLWMNTASEPPLIDVAEELTSYLGTSLAVRLIATSGASVTGVVLACGSGVVCIGDERHRERSYVALDSLSELWSSSRP